MAKKLAASTRSVVFLGRFARRMGTDEVKVSSPVRPTFWPVGQFLTGQIRIVGSLGAIGLAILLGGCGPASAPGGASGGNGPSPIRRGGAIVASTRNDPGSFNRYFQNDVATDLVNELTQARLVRVNKATWDVEPWLAESWTESPDHLRYTLKLRSGVRFSDGHPFTADDVLFTFAALYDPKSVGDSTLADAMMVNGKPLSASALDPQTVVITFPEPFAPGVRLLDNIPMLPKHTLEGALSNGTLARSYSLTTPPADIVGLGPFVIKEYVAGQRTVFERNPHYWRKAADGTALPYLDRITLETIPDQNAEILRIANGQQDVGSGEVPAESYASARRAADAGTVALTDLGLDRKADSFWINLKPGAFKGDPRAAWIQRDEFRRAISMGVDRKAFADAAFFGAGEPVYGPVTPAVKRWYWTGTPVIPYDPDGAKKLLASIGVPVGTPAARFQVIYQTGRPRLARGASVIAEELRKIGLTVDPVGYDTGNVIRHWLSGQYDALYFSPGVTDIDPAESLDFWLSSGGSHFWNPSQKKPATEWEKRIDELFAKQTAAFDMAERKRLFDEVQKIFVEHQPIVYFAAPRFFVATSTRIANAKPALHWIPILWAADELAVRQ